MCFSSTAHAGGKVAVYGIRMTPLGNDAEQYSRAGWGGGLRVTVPLPRPGHFLAGALGVEYVNLLSETVSFQDRVTGLRVEQQTDQRYIRIIIGAEVGGHGHGFLRPYAALHFAVINYGISTDVVVPDDYNRENEIRQNLSGEDRWVTGFDITAGLDLNVSEHFSIDGGVRFLKTLSLVQQLGEGSVRIHPGYLVVYLGVGFPFDLPW
jgi:hypothetical protein